MLEKEATDDMEILPEYHQKGLLVFIKGWGLLKYSIYQMPSCVLTLTYLKLQHQVLSKQGNAAQYGPRLQVKFWKKTPSVTSNWILFFLPLFIIKQQKSVFKWNTNMQWYNFVLNTLWPSNARMHLTTLFSLDEMMQYHQIFDKASGEPTLTL